MAGEPSAGSSRAWLCFLGVIVNITLVLYYIEDTRDGLVDSLTEIRWESAALLVITVLALVGLVGLLSVVRSQLEICLYHFHGWWPSLEPPVDCDDLAARVPGAWPRERLQAPAPAPAPALPPPPPPPSPAPPAPKASQEGPKAPSPFKGFSGRAFRQPERRSYPSLPPSPPPPPPPPPAQITTQRAGPEDERPQPQLAPSTGPPRARWWRETKTYRGAAKQARYEQSKYGPKAPKSGRFHQMRQESTHAVISDGASIHRDSAVDLSPGGFKTSTGVAYAVKHHGKVLGDARVKKTSAGTKETPAIRLDRAPVDDRAGVTEKKKDSSTSERQADVQNERPILQSGNIDAQKPVVSTFSPAVQQSAAATPAPTETSMPVVEEAVAVEQPSMPSPSTNGEAVVVIPTNNCCIDDEVLEDAPPAPAAQFIDSAMPLDASPWLPSEGIESMTDIEFTSLCADIEFPSLCTDIEFNSLCEDMEVPSLPADIDFTSLPADIEIPSLSTDMEFTTSLSEAELGGFGMEDLSAELTDVGDWLPEGSDSLPESQAFLTAFRKVKNGLTGKLFEEPEITMDVDDSRCDFGPAPVIFDATFLGLLRESLDSVGAEHEEVEVDWAQFEQEVEMEDSVDESEEVDMQDGVR